jgi:hypothetical protein
MDTSKILNDLRAERDRIQRAIEALESLDSSPVQTVSRPQQRRGRKPASAQPAEKPVSVPRKRTMSAAARRRISQAAKKRWAERKKALA